MQAGYPMTDLPGNPHYEAAVTNRFAGDMRFTEATLGDKMSTIPELQERAYRQSADKGFHDDDTAIIDYLRETGHPKWAAMVEVWMNGNRIALQHSELSEALEELRKGRAVNETYYPTAGNPGVFEKAGHKPEGVPSELADTVIRILDFAGTNNIDLEAIILEKLDYNATRGHKHGGKRF